MPPASETALPLERTARRAGWLLLAVAGAAAVLGLVDPAALSQATATADGGRMRLEYSRLDRAAAPTRLRLWVGPGGGSPDGRLRVRFNASYARTMRLVRVSPPAEKVEAGAEEVTFVFRRLSTRDPALIEFDLRPADLGRYTGRLAVAEDRSLEFTQYMVP